MSERWEASREQYEHVLREAIVVPEEAHSVALSLDGVMAPIDGGRRRTEVRNQAAAEGRVSKGPAGYREIGCATISFCDAQGELISAIRAPESKKVTLKERLTKDIAHIAHRATRVEFCQDYRCWWRQLGVSCDAPIGTRGP